MSSIDATHEAEASVFALNATANAALDTLTEAVAAAEAAVAKIGMTLVRSDVAHFEMKRSADAAEAAEADTTPSKRVRYDEAAAAVVAAKAAEAAVADASAASAAPAASAASAEAAEAAASAEAAAAAEAVEAAEAAVEEEPIMLSRTLSGC